MECPIRFTGIDALTVTLKRGAKNAVSISGIPGLYVVGPKLISTKLHWLPLQDSGSNAIWYSNEHGTWIIGSQDAIGQKILPASILSLDDVESPQEVTTWQYYDGKMLIPIDDILVEPGTQKVR